MKVRTIRHGVYLYLNVLSYRQDALKELSSSKIGLQLFVEKIWSGHTPVQKNAMTDIFAKVNAQSHCLDLTLAHFWIHIDIYRRNAIIFILSGGSSYPFGSKKYTSLYNT